MAVQRREFIFGAFLLATASVIFVIISIASNSWVVSSYTETESDNDLWYGLFNGQSVERLLNTPTTHDLYVTCVQEIGACAVSCKTTAEAREAEVRALAQGFRPNLLCGSFTTVSEENPLTTPPVITVAFYACMVLVLSLQLLFSAASAALAILNATTNPTEPAFGLPGCLWSNAVAAVLGFLAMMMFGIHWATSGLKEHLAFATIALGDYELRPRLGYAYWLLITAVIFSLTNVGLIELRRYLLERDPPPPTIKVDNHSDGFWTRWFDQKTRRALCNDITKDNITTA